MMSNTAGWNGESGFPPQADRVGARDQYPWCTEGVWRKRDPTVSNLGEFQGDMSTEPRNPGMVGSCRGSRLFRV